MLKSLSLVAAACLLLAAAAAPAARAAAGPPVFKEAELPCHRLPLNVRPTHYDVHLKFPSFESDVYEGQVNISVKFSGGRNCLAARGDEEFEDMARAVKGVACDTKGTPNQIVLHADESLDIQEVSLSSEPLLKFLSNGRQKEREIVELVRDRPKQLVALRLKKPLRAGSSGTISFTFKGKLRQDKRGVYVSTYNDGKSVYKHIVSQFQPTDARTVLPSFDEPRFKVPFSLKLTHNRGLTAYATMEPTGVAHEAQQLATTSFETTPKMPIHMVGFVIGQFDPPLEMELPAGDGKRQARNYLKKVRVIMAPGKRESGQFAIRAAADALLWFEHYIDYEFPLEKLDVIAIADSDKGNTESWGLVVLRDTFLWNDAESTPDSRITTVVYVAHVVVHQWFANLVSAAWWSELYLTEGVAAQFAFKIVQELYDFQSEFTARLGTLSSAMQMDQPGLMHALAPREAELQTSAQIYGIFDKLGFMKSASLAQMVEDSLNDKTRYRNGLRRLVAERAFKTITLADYMEALTGTGNSKDFDNQFKMLESFAQYHGVPVINVHLDSFGRLGYDLESFANARRAVESVPKKQKQSVTIYTTRKVADGATISDQHTGFYAECIAGQENAYAARTPAWWAPSPRTHHFVKISAVPSLANYYRTRYSDELLVQLHDAVKHKWLSPMNRLQILEDATQFVEAELMRIDAFKELLEAYATEDDDGVLIGLLVAAKTFKTLEARKGMGAASKEALDRPATFMRAFWRLFERHGFEGPTSSDTFIRQRARRLVLSALILQGNQQVISAALVTFECKASLPGGVALFLRDPVYMAVALAGSVESVQALLAKLDATASYEEKLRLVAALSLSKDKEVLARTQAWLAASGLKAETIKPYETAIAAALAQ